MLDSLRTLDDAHVTRLLRRRKGASEMLGFGLAETGALVTPVLWLAVTEVVNRGAGTAAHGLLARLRSAARSLLRHPRGEAVAVPSRSAGQLVAVHRRVLDRAVDAGIDGQQAQALTDAVVSRLARETTS
ncbi:hypothetical protein [Streptomyces sp. NPDC052721]|uniref:hypothetical protein n=1 Tax=Streptomyces sp. NPDC052721 TaxID=3154955 RepID=UPI00342EDED8